MDIAKTFWIIYASVAALLIIVFSLLEHYQEKNFVVFGFLVLGIVWFFKSFFYVSAKEKRKQKKEEEEYLAKQKKLEEEEKKTAELKKEAKRKVAQEIKEKKEEIAKAAWNKYYTWKPFEEVDKLSGIDFEKYLVKLLIEKGYKDVKKTKSSGDQGIDILFTDENGNKVGIQAKRSKDTIGNRAVQELIAGMLFYECQKGIVATTSSFTSSAKELAEKKDGISLWNRSDIKKLYKETTHIEIPPFSRDKAIALGINTDGLNQYEEQTIYEKYGFDYFTKEFLPHKCKEIIHYSYSWSNGNKYVGEWKDDKRHGQGTHTWPSGKKYVGEWKNGKKYGQGTYTYSDGNKYVGELKDDKKHGQGTETYSSGNKYVGEWEDGKKCGKGTLTSPNGIKYDGEWKDDKMCGKGTLTWPNGEEYVGVCKNNKVHGQGTMTYANGNKYVGEYEDGRASGGWYYWSNGQKTWSHKNTSGEWVHSTKDEGVEELPN